MDEDAELGIVVPVGYGVRPNRFSDWVVVFRGAESRGSNADAKKPWKDLLVTVLVYTASTTTPEQACPMPSEE